MAFGSSNTFKSYIDETKEEPLITFDDVDPKDLSDNPEREISEDEVRNADHETEAPTQGTDHKTVDEIEPVDTMSNSSAKLCGYLNKYKRGARGIAKIFKKRWFVFVDSSCKLLYFRTPQDIVPLGEIDVSNASFNLEISQDGGNSSGRDNVFEIRCSDKTVALEAPDAQTRMYWLQQLQTRRRRYSKRRTELLKEEQQSIKSVQEPSAGLIGKNRNLSSSGEQNSSEWALLNPVDVPAESIGEASATSGVGTITDLSITNWKTEIRNVLANLRGKRQSDIMEGSILASPVEEKLVSFPEEPISPPSPTSPDAKSKSPSSPNSKESRFSNFKKRISSGSHRPKSLSVEDGTSNDIYEQKYKQLQVIHANQKEDMSVLEDELTTHREIITVLQRQIDISQRSQATKQELEACTVEKEKMDLLEQRDKQIVELQHLLAAIQEEREVATAKLREMESELNCIRDQVNMYKSSVSAKDETIMSLTNKIFDLECSSGQTSAQQSLSTINLVEMEKLQAALDAYKVQNQFLNKEIMELTKLRADDEAREKQLFTKSTEAEAKFYQIQSKYLLCLDQLRAPLRGGEESRSDEFVTQLLQDALESSGSEENKISSTSFRHSSGQYDKFGFSLLPLGGSDDLVAHAHTLQRKSDELQAKDVQKEMTLIVKWENYLTPGGPTVLQPSSELKNLIRLGVPIQHRERVWNACVNFRVGKLRYSMGAKYYHTLLEQLSKVNKINPASKQIEMDLLRTLPNNKHYEKLNSEGIPKLRRVLLAFTQHNPELGYCQGLNRLAAIALLFLNEEDAFWCLVCIVEFLMPPDYYTTSLLAAMVDQRVLAEIIQDKLPRLNSHLKAHNVDLSLFAYTWFLTVFVDNIPVNTYLRIWDTFLYEGSKVLFRYAVAFFKHKEDGLLEQPDLSAINNFIRSMGESMTNIDRITQIAFHEINPFSMKNINSKRQAHSPDIQEMLDMYAADRKKRSTRKKPEVIHYDLVSDDDL